MCLPEADVPTTPEPAAPPVAADKPPELEVDTKTKRRSDELSSKAKGTKKYRVDTTSKASGNLSGLSIPT